VPPRPSEEEGKIRINAKTRRYFICHLLLGRKSIKE
jgi:hypothetical protein